MHAEQTRIFPHQTATAAFAIDKLALLSAWARQRSAHLPHGCLPTTASGLIATLIR